MTEPRRPASIGTPSSPTEVPANLTPPSLSESSYTVGDSPTWTQGIWSNGPITARAFQLYADGVAISGATVSGATALTGAEEGADITVGEVATNVIGDSDEAVSAAVGPVAAAEVPAVSIVAAPSSPSIAEDAGVGTIITTFSILNGSGTYTWFLVDGGGDQSSATTLHDIGGNEAELRVAALNYETDPELSVSVQIDNGVDTPITQAFVVTVTDVEETSSGIAPVLVAIGAI